MREFLLFVFIAKATAARLGYDYQPVGQAAAFGSGDRATSNGGTAAAAANEQTYTNSQAHGVANAFSSGLSGLDSGYVNLNTNSIAATDNSGHADNFGNHGKNFNNPTNPSTQPIIESTKFHKEFFSYTAPDEAADLNDDELFQMSPIRKNLRVIFIKAPENQALTNAALQLAKQAMAGRTAIYVLTKQTDAVELANRLQAIKRNQQQQQQQANKPEVHFVKYRTPEDAVRAQQAIKAQYDALDGPTLNSNEGIAPVLNFAAASSATTAAVGGGSGVGSGLLAGSSLSNGLAQDSANGYLPPTALLKL